MRHSQLHGWGRLNPRNRKAPLPPAQGSFRPRFIPPTLIATAALTLALSARGADLPVLTAGHTDVGVNYEDGAWDLHVHAEEVDLEYAPDAVWLKIAAPARTVVPSASAFSFLGAPGAPLWMLPATQKPGLLFLGLGTEEMASGIFSNNTVRLSLKSVEGPGDFIAYQLDAFGTPAVSFSSRDGIDGADTRSLSAGGHTHVNWVFTAPGQYRIGLQASGVLAATGETTTSDVAEYLFDVGELPRLSLIREEGHDHLHLEWLSETNASYQIQHRPKAALGAWSNLGSPIAGTGDVMEAHIEPELASQFVRVVVNYGSGVEPGRAVQRLTKGSTSGPAPLSHPVAAPNLH